jgi:CxxC motif-containing protein (DUF1111 family)
MRTNTKRRLLAGARVLAPIAGFALVIAQTGAGKAADHGATYPVGSPLAGLSADFLTLFQQGSERFQHQFTPTEGLGPIYNESACVTCHGAVAPGGGDPLPPGSIHNVTHFSKDTNGYYDPLRDLGGPLLEKRSINQDDGITSCPLLATTVPAVANIISIRNTPPVFGFGLLDAIPDQEILDGQLIDVDGINGVPNWGQELQAMEVEPIQGLPLPFYGNARVGRFGWKAQTATLQQFSAEPFNTELGVSNIFFPQEHTANGQRFPAQLPAGCQLAAHNPNDIDQTQALALYHFQALLAPPPPAARDQHARRGEREFYRAGCHNCHTPEMLTGPIYNMRLADGSTVRVPELENQVVHAYSDLLLHDMGPGLADDAGTNLGRVMGRADGSRWRTTPLWGIRFKQEYLHDGRTTEIRDAILQHGGESQIVRDRFAGLSQRAQQDLVAFLLTL